MIASLTGWGIGVVLNAAALALAFLVVLLPRFKDTSAEVDRVVQQDSAGMDDGLSMQGERLADEVEDWLRNEGGQAA